MAGVWTGDRWWEGKVEDSKPTLADKLKTQKLGWARSRCNCLAWWLSDTQWMPWDISWNLTCIVLAYVVWNTNIWCKSRKLWPWKIKIISSCGVICMGVSHYHMPHETTVQITAQKWISSAEHLEKAPGWWWRNKLLHASFWQITCYIFDFDAECVSLISTFGACLCRITL